MMREPVSVSRASALAVSESSGRTRSQLADIAGGRHARPDGT